MTTLSKAEDSEAASEKRRRGRPRIMDEEWHAIVDALTPEVRTERARHDFHYRTKAIQTLCYEPRFAWLADEGKMAVGAKDAWKPSILAELGRIRDADTLRAVALRICELRPSTKEAVALIRRFRLGREAHGDYRALWMHLARALDEYVAVHPSTSVEWKVKALLDLAACVRDDDESEVD